jgi:hypothetical protein
VKRNAPGLSPRPFSERFPEEVAGKRDPTHRH